MLHKKVAGVAMTAARDSLLKKTSLGHYMRWDNLVLSFCVSWYLNALNHSFENRYITAGLRWHLNRFPVSFSGRKPHICFIDSSGWLAMADSGTPASPFKYSRCCVKQSHNTSYSINCSVISHGISQSINTTIIELFVEFAIDSHLVEFGI